MSNSSPSRTSSRSQTGVKYVKRTAKSTRQAPAEPSPTSGRRRSGRTLQTSTSSPVRTSNKRSRGSEAFDQEEYQDMKMRHEDNPQSQPDLENEQLQSQSPSNQLKASLSDPQRKSKRPEAHSRTTSPRLSSSAPEGKTDGQTPRPNSPSHRNDQEYLRIMEPSRLPELQPAQPNQPRHVVVHGTITARPFPCCFAPYNCNASFTSKNEWKRHISTKHIQLGFWRCDMCTPSPGLDHPVYNDFNRKDLFTQHLRRMHAPGSMVKDGELDPSTGPVPQPAVMQLTEDEILQIQKRCYRVLRTPPLESGCIFCTRHFHGPNSWDERLEHVGGHLERDRKNGMNCLDIASWRPDDELRNYLLREGIVEQDVRGNWRIGDGRPRRPTDIEPISNPPSATTGAGQSQSVASPQDQDSDGGMSKRRRGRPPKRYSESETPPVQRLAPQPLGEMRPRPSEHLAPPPMNHSPRTPGPLTPSDFRNQNTIRPSSRMETPGGTPQSAGTHTSGGHRMEQYHTIAPPPHSLAPQFAMSPGPSLPHIMPRTPTAFMSGHGPQQSPISMPQQPHQVSIAPAYHNVPPSSSREHLGPLTPRPEPGLANIAPAPASLPRDSQTHGLRPEQFPQGQVPAAIMGPNGPIPITPQQLASFSQNISTGQSHVSPTLQTAPAHAAATHQIPSTHPLAPTPPATLNHPNPLHAHRPTTPQSDQPGQPPNGGERVALTVEGAGQGRVGTPTPEIGAGVAGRDVNESFGSRERDGSDGGEEARRKYLNVVL